MTNWVVAECKHGHLFETPFIPMMSFKAVRLGNLRFMRCPVGHHWTTVHFPDPSTLSRQDAIEAREHRTSAVP